MKSTIISLAALIAVTACAEVTTTTDPLTQAVSGRTFSHSPLGSQGQRFVRMLHSRTVSW